ncbi:MAG: hypothetical protein FJ202_09310 [Gemmatimonadetes bacterium]|nr:hypothetical protein [Gemmatimonadota bacterium]
MTRRILVGILLVSAAATEGAAQCASAPLAARQACYASVDLVNYMTPQLSTAIAGGNSTLGQGGALGGLGHVAVSVRATAVLNGAFPNIGDKGFNTNGTPQSYTTESQIVPGVGVDGSIGIFKGINLGVTHVGAVDALVSALYVPDIEGEGSDFSVRATDGNLKLGFGARIGIIEENLAAPGISISYLKRDLPTVNLTGSATAQAGSVGTASGSFGLNSFSVKTTAIRLTAAKSLLLFGVQAGIGRDTYESTANISATVSGASATGAASMNMTRNNMFVGASLNLFLLKIVGEYGQVSGGSLATPFNTFDKKASDSRSYGSLGVRISF